MVEAGAQHGSHMFLELRAAAAAPKHVSVADKLEPRFERELGRDNVVQLVLMSCLFVARRLGGATMGKHGLAKPPSAAAQPTKRHRKQTHERP